MKFGDRPPVVFEEVTFTYPDTEQPVVRDLSLELPSGVVSLVGQNGTGKSTLLLLACGLLVPDRGRVLLGGVDSRELSDDHQRRRLCSLVYQNMEFETQEPLGELLGVGHGKSP